MRPMLKYCGNQSLADLRLVNASRADYIGFIFTEKSKRTVQPQQVADWLRRTPLRPGKQLVGVFADDAEETIAGTLGHVALDVLQFHGNETPEFVRRIKQTSGRRVWKTLHHGADTQLQMQRFAGLVDGYIVDTKVAGQLGGTGQSFDWASVPGYKAEAARQGVRCLIAGGIRPQTITRLLSFRPDGIDIASGIERNDQKDGTLIQLIEEKVCETQ